MTEKLLNKIAVVTGAAGETGADVCELFAAEGATVVRMDDYPTDPAVCAELAAKTFEQYGRVDVLVNCTPEGAALLPAGETGDEEYEDAVLKSQTAPFYICREMFRRFREQGFGVCVNVGGIAAAGGTAGLSYELAQHGLMGLTRNIALQYVGNPDIRCNMVCAGRLHDFESEDEAYLGFVNNKNKTGYVPAITARDVSKAVLFFACDDSSRINGQFLQIDLGTYFKEA